MRAGGGEDFIIAVRVSAEDVLHPDGTRIEDIVGFAQEVDGIPDIIEIMNGTKLDGWRSKGFTSAYEPAAINAEHAAKVKAVCKKSYVAVNGGIQDEDVIERILEEKKADFVVLGRQMFADNQFTNKLKEGRTKEIRHCLRCYSCSVGEPEEPTDLLWLEKGLSPEDARKMIMRKKGGCAMDPESTMIPPEIVAEIPKRIMIIGGGPAGLESAIVSKAHGNLPVIVEMADKLGGMLNTTEYALDKREDKRYKEWLLNEIERMEIPVVLNQKADKTYILEERPDAVICAIGAKITKDVKIRGVETYTIDAAKAFDSPQKIGKRVVVIGGGLSGCEAALYCASLGSEVTLFEKNQRLIPDTFGWQRASIIGNMKRRGIKIHVNTRCIEATSEGVIAVDHTGDFKLVSPAKELQKFEADTIICATGMAPLREEAEVLGKICEEQNIAYYEVGNVVQPGRLAESVGEAYDVAMGLL